ncbi:uncharacterized protein G2W53_014692 [Senna tora]|uniref:RNase H type-1 domain-containing protein n=1 Tax=Senna tora TaxID=362788 RepID=A0A834WTX1_9FABA|nr:uncharacterized protein G2W53_014692 [Senna tora]
MSGKGTTMSGRGYGRQIYLGKFDPFAGEHVVGFSQHSSILSSERVEVPTQCCVCGIEGEDTTHALVNCAELTPLWSSYSSGVTRMSVAGMTFVDWFAEKLQVWTTKQMETLCISAYRVWNRRNKIRLGERAEDLSKLRVEAAKMWETLNEKVQLITEGENEETRNCQTKAKRDKGWTTPSWREMKINVDANLNGQGRGGIGCVVRNYERRCLATLAKRMDNFDSVEILEAYAFLEGLGMAKKLRCDNVILEGDAKNVVDLVNSKTPNLSALGMLVEDIRKAMGSMNTVRIQWTPRSCNAVANRVANFACDLDNFQVCWRLVWFKMKWMEIGEAIGMSMTGVGVTTSISGDAGVVW